MKHTPSKLEEKKVKVYVVTCLKCGKKCEGSTEKQCLANFKQHWEGTH